MIKNLPTDPGLHYSPDQWPKNCPWLVNLNIYANNSERVQRLGNIYIWLDSYIGRYMYYSYGTGDAWRFRTKEDAMLFYITWL